METIWTLKSRVYKDLLPAGTRTRILQCAISQNWLMTISKRFPNHYSMTFPFQCYYSASVHVWAMNEHDTRPNQAISNFTENRVYDMGYFMQFFSGLVRDVLHMLLHNRRQQMILVHHRASLV